MKAFITAFLDDEELKRLEKRCEIVYEPWRKTNEIYFDSKVLSEKLKGFDIFITEADEIKDDLIELTDLKIIAACRHDPYKIRVDAATKKNIPVLYTPARNADSVADLAVSFMLNCLRKITQIDRFLHSNNFEVVEFEDWIKISNDYIGSELKNKTVGIIGLGNVGQKVASRVLAFGAKVLIYDPYITENVCEKFGKGVELKDLMQKSDIITLHAAPTDDSENMVSEEMIALMKPTAYLINTAKASMVDNEALEKALAEKKIAGAALDVFDMEPLDEDNEFLQFDNVICMPHFGGNTVDTVKRQSEMIIDDILAILDKKMPKNILNPEVLGGKKKEKTVELLRKELLETCQLLVKEGYISGSSGNVSVRIPDEEKVIITPSQTDYDEMNVDDLVIIDFDGKVLSGERNPSVEKNLHLSIYKNREDVGAVIHSHGMYSTAISLHRESLPTLPAIIEEFVPYVGGPVTIAEYGEAGSSELASNVLGALEEKNAVILSNHGNVCCGSHLKGALTVLRMVERAAKIYILSRILGKPNELPEDTIDYELDIFDIFKESKKI